MPASYAGDGTWGVVCQAVRARILAEFRLFLSHLHLPCELKLLPLGHLRCGPECCNDIQPISLV